MPGLRHRASGRPRPRGGGVSRGAHQGQSLRGNQGLAKRLLYRLSVAHADGGLKEAIPAPIAARRPAFLANRRLDVVKMNEALAKRDFAAIQVVGHNCKGIGTGYGFPDISSAGSAIEIAARAQNIGEVEKCIREFERCVPADQPVK
jgi:hypothetical protein